MSHEELITHLQSKRRDIAADQPVAIEIFKPEDALGVSLAYYEIYGESFPVGHVYDPEEVVRRNATENQYTVVARTPKGEIVGLAGLFRHAPNKDVYEAGQLMVLKSYRSGEVAKKISSLLLDELPLQHNIGVIFAEAVCNHPVSQQLAYMKGLLPTGLALECMPADVYASEGNASRNVSLLLMFAVKNDVNHTVYLPEIYQRFIVDLYKTVGLQRTYAAGRNLTEKTKLNEFFLPDAKLIRLTIEKAGIDFSSVIDGIENRVGQETLIQTYLNLGDKAAPEAIKLLCKKGYIFGGLLPLWFGSDGIIMQKLIREPAWEKIRLRHKESKKMLNYLRNDYDCLMSETI